MKEANRVLATLFPWFFMIRRKSCSGRKHVYSAYEAGSDLVRAGAVSGYNMTTESAAAKLSYLLSQDLSTSQIRELMETDLRGELDK